MIEGLRTVIYPVADLTRATTWYSALLGQEPYFDEPFYVGSRYQWNRFVRLGAFARERAFSGP